MSANVMAWSRRNLAVCCRMCAAARVVEGAALHFCCFSPGHTMQTVKNTPARWPMALAFTFSAIVLLAVGLLAWHESGQTAIVIDVLVLLLLLLLIAVYRRTVAAGLPRQLLKAG